MIEDSGFLASSIGGASLLGVVMGFAAKKLIKIVAVIVGLELGLLALLERQGVISVQWAEFSSWMQAPDAEIPPAFSDIALSTGLVGGGVSWRVRTRLQERLAPRPWSFTPPRRQATARTPLRLTLLSPPRPSRPTTRFRTLQYERASLHGL